MSRRAKVESLFAHRHGLVFYLHRYDSSWSKRRDHAASNGVDEQLVHLPDAIMMTSPRNRVVLRECVMRVGAGPARQFTKWQLDACIFQTKSLA